MKKALGPAIKFVLNGHRLRGHPKKLKRYPKKTRLGSGPLRRSSMVASVALLVVGAGLAAYGIGQGQVSKSAAAATPLAYVEKAPCPSCPPSTRIDSVEVQSREGSVLFILRGKWPATVDELKTSVRLVVGDVEIVVKPHGSQSLFELPVATRGGRALPSGSVAAGLQQGVLLIDVGSPALNPPLSFEVGLWSGTAYLQRVPSAGRLDWSGVGTPRPHGIGPSPSPTATAPAPPSPSVVPSTSPSVDLTVLAGACANISGGTVPAFLQMTRLSSFGPMPDPRTGTLSRKVTATLVASPLDRTTPFSIAAVVLHDADGPPAGRQLQAIDRVGEVQLWLYFDGTTKHKGIRTYSGGVWTMKLDVNANNLTYDLAVHGTAYSASFFWTGLAKGDRFGFVTSSASGCAASGLDAQLVPIRVVT